MALFDSSCRIGFSYRLLWIPDCSESQAPSIIGDGEAVMVWIMFVLDYLPKASTSVQMDQEGELASRVPNPDVPVLLARSQLS